MTRLDELRALTDKRADEWMDALAEHVVGIAKVMGEIHGGQWDWHVDHQAGCVMILAHNPPDA